MACAAAASSNSQTQAAIKERRSLVRRRKAYQDALLGKLLNNASETLRTLRVGGLETAPPWAVRISKSVCLPFGTQAVLIWRGEKNRGDHPTI